MDSWVLGPVATTNRGVKSACILSHGSPPCKILATASDPLTTPFGSSSYENSNRLSIDFSIDKSLEKWLESLDEWAQKTLLKESPRLFQKQLTEQELAQMYQSVIKKHEKDDTVFPSTVRCKFTTSRLKHWGFDHKPREAPVDYK